VRRSSRKSSSKSLSKGKGMQFVSRCIVVYCLREATVQPARKSLL
jgi:hypothetical protein